MHPSDVTRALAKLAMVCVLAFATLLAPSVAAYAEPVTCGSLTISHRDGLVLKEGTDFTYASNVLTIKTLKPVVVGMSDQGDGASPDRIVVDPGETSTAHVTLSDVSIDASDKIGAPALEVSSGLLELTLSGSSNLASGYGSAGLQNNECPLTIKGSGELEAIGGYDGAGIGGGMNASGSNITVAGGTVIARGGSEAAGIGGGKSGAGHAIVISGGSVTALGGEYGSGIGGGWQGPALDVTISDGEVSATGGYAGAGVGGGGNGDAEGLTISGGKVSATGGFNAAGIGSGSGGSVPVSASDIVISGGEVIATGGSNAAGIGGGVVGSASDITISGGLIDARADSYAAPIGNGRGVTDEDAPVAPPVITGGSFADSSETAVENNSVYGIELSDRVDVIANGDEETSGSYPVTVLFKGDLIVTPTVEGDALTPGEDYTYPNGVLLLRARKPVTVSQHDTILNPSKGDSSATADRIVVDPGEGSEAQVTLAGVRIASSDRSAMSVDSGSLALTLAGENSLVSGGSFAGLQSGEHPLTILGEGSLDAKGGYGAAGIGGGNRGSAAQITIEQGNVTAAGGTGGAGIGSGYGGSASEITVSGGTVVVDGGYGGAGIGSGVTGACTNVTISDGTVIAHGGVNAAGIGSGDGGTASGISVLSGTVSADGGSYGPGIGGGYRGSVSDVTISGGEVSVRGGYTAAGIGGGFMCSATGVSISGGRISITPGEWAPAIGDGLDAEGGDAPALTGGVYADFSETAVADNTAYGAAPASGYAIWYNNDPNTMEKYPVRVYESAPLDVTEKSSGLTTTYDGSSVSLEPEDVIEARRADTPIDADELAIVYAPHGTDAWSQEAPSNAGGYDLRISVSGTLVGDVCYRPLDVVLSGEKGWLVIEPAKLTVTADSASTIFNAPLPEFTYQVDGFVGTDDASVVTGAPVLSCSSYVQGASGVGETYEILVDVSGMSAENYKFVAVPGTLTVGRSASQVTIDGDGQHKTLSYGDTLVVRGNVAATGEAPAETRSSRQRALEAPESDQVALFFNDVQLSEASDVLDDRSFSLTYETTERMIPAGGATLEVRYVGTQNQADAVATAEITVLKAQLTPIALTVLGAGRAYDGTVALPEDADVEVAFSGAVLDDGVALVATDAAYVSPHAQTRTVEASAFEIAASVEGEPVWTDWYEVAAPDQPLTANDPVGIQPCELSVAWDNYTDRSYADGAGDVACTVMGALDQDVASGAVSWAVTGVDAESAAGDRTAKVALAANANSNYQLDNGATLSYHVSKAPGFPASVTLEGWTAGETPNEPVAEVSGGDYGAATFEYRAADAADDAFSPSVPEAAGNYVVRATWAATDNCEATSATTEFTIAPEEVVTPPEGEGEKPGDEGDEPGDEGETPGADEPGGDEGDEPETPDANEPGEDTDQGPDDGAAEPDGSDETPDDGADEKPNNAGTVNGSKPSEGPSTVGQGASEHERVPSTGDFSPNASAVLLAGFAAVLIAALSRRCRS